MDGLPGFGIPDADMINTYPAKIYKIQCEGPIQPLFKFTSFFTKFRFSE